MNAQQLAAAIGCHIDRALKWFPHLTRAMEKYGITTVEEQASFLAQISHESNMLSALEENLNYSSDGLAKTWPSRYRDKVTGKPNSLAQLLHRRGISIANNCYANRMGNGDVSSGDGWKYRGRGLIQLTGRNMYKKCGDAIGLDLINKPDLLLQPEAAALSAAWYWHVSGLDALDDDESITAETRVINGGTNGLADRENKFKKALVALRGNHAGVTTA
jgi:putative chitinase